MSLNDINKMITEGGLSSLQFVKYDIDEDMLKLAFNSESGGDYENKELQVNLEMFLQYRYPAF